MSIQEFVDKSRAEGIRILTEDVYIYLLFYATKAEKEYHRTRKEVSPTIDAKKIYAIMTRRLPSKDKVVTR